MPAGAPPPVCAKPTPNFTWTRAESYDYRDRRPSRPASCPITDWVWTFTDAGGTHSNAQNPATVTYSNNSAHPVTLTVTNAGGAARSR